MPKEEVTSKEKQKNTPKLVWDLPIRVFHWLLAILILGSWYTVEIDYEMTNHMRIGYAVLTLLLFRLIWGFVGPKYARFSSFVFGPRETLDYIKYFFSKKRGAYAGHNPLGAIATFVMLSVLIFQGVTGLFATDDFYVYGPFSGWVSGEISFLLTDLHYKSSDILFIIIGIHIAAIFYYVLFKRHNLIKSMLTGRKSNLQSHWESISSSKTMLAIVLMLVCSGAIYALITYANS